MTLVNDQQEHLTQKTLPIDVMMCGGCAGRIIRVLTHLDEVQEASVSLEENQATVTFDSGQTDVNTLQCAIEQADFHVPNE